MKLLAHVKIDGYSLHGLSSKDIEAYVTAQLTSIISKEVTKNMTISSIKDVYDDSITYIGTITGSSNTYTSGTSGVYTSTNSINSIASSSSNRNYSQINMRVVEYTKNGKVTRVELQKHDEDIDDWVKIPRIQIEE